VINDTKSTIHQVGLFEQELVDYKAMFPFNFSDLASVFTYLGFNLKTSPRRASDGNWLIQILEKNITNWCFRWLSLGGRFTLCKAI
jgi:hypothetical protein